MYILHILTYIYRIYVLPWDIWIGDLYQTAGAQIHGDFIRAKTVPLPLESGNRSLGGHCDSNGKRTSSYFVLEYDLFILFIKNE